LSPLLASFDPSSLENALNAIGFSRDLALAPVVESYRNDPNPSVRAAAENALRELTDGASV
jgi:HEAT repeat protein